MASKGSGNAMSHTAHPGEEEGLSSSYPLPCDLIRRIVSLLPSSLLFECRVLSKSIHAYVPLALSHRPFVVYQAPSSQCFLLPLDSLSTPFPCTFTLGVSSFTLAFARSNLLCMRRGYPSMVDICVCDIFRRRKVMVPPIVHPDYVPRLLQRVFLEDPDVDGLSFIGFHAFDANPQDGSPQFRIFIANNVFLRVYDSCRNQWSRRAHFPAHLCTSFPRPIYSLARPPTPPHCFIASDGTIILTFTHLGRALFNYDDLSFHVIEARRPAFPSFEIAGFQASACVEARSFNLEIHLPHVEGMAGSNLSRGLVLKGLCEGDHGVHCTASFRVVLDGASLHQHRYERHLLHSYCHVYENTVYALVMEEEEMVCSNETVRGLTREWHDLPVEGPKKYLCPDGGSGFDCEKYFPACSSSLKLMLYTACVDTTDWTMQMLNKTDATALLPLAEPNNSEVRKFVFMNGSHVHGE